MDVDEAGEAEQDEEEVRLEREALEVISARAAEYVLVSLRSTSYEPNLMHRTVI